MRQTRNRRAQSENGVSRDESPRARSFPDGDLGPSRMVRSLLAAGYGRRGSGHVDRGRCRSGSTRTGGGQGIGGGIARADATVAGARCGANALADGYAGGAAGDFPTQCGSLAALNRCGLRRELRHGRSGRRGSGPFWKRRCCGGRRCGPGPRRNLLWMISNNGANLTGNICVGFILIGPCGHSLPVPGYGLDSPKWKRVPVAGP